MLAYFRRKGMFSFGLSYEDAQDKDVWRLKIKRLPWKMAIKVVFICLWNGPARVLLLHYM